MRILIFADSHGTSENMSGLVLSLRPDMIIHLGDGLSDLASIESLRPEIAVRTVKGNNDFLSGAPESACFTLCGRRIFMTHGHLYNAKNGYFSLIQKAKNENADILLFGHTHKPANYIENSLLIFNPGSYSGRTRNGGNYGLIELDEEGNIKASVRNIKDDDS